MYQKPVSGKSPLAAPSPAVTVSLRSAVGADTAFSPVHLAMFEACDLIQYAHVSDNVVLILNTAAPACR